MGRERLLERGPLLGEEFGRAIRSRWRVRTDALPRLLEVGADRLPLVGRSEELARLREAWTAVTAGGRQIVSLVGEPGIGKTRPVRQPAAQLPPARPARGRRFGGSPGGAGPPFP